MTPRQLERVFRLNMVFARRQYRKLRGERLPSGAKVGRRFIRTVSCASAMQCVRLALEFKAFVSFRFEVKE